MSKNKYCWSGVFLFIYVKACGKINIISPFLRLGSLFSFLGRRFFLSPLKWITFCCCLTRKSVPFLPLIDQRRFIRTVVFRTAFLLPEFVLTPFGISSLLSCVPIFHFPSRHYKIINHSKHLILWWTPSWSATTWKERFRKSLIWKEVRFVKVSGIFNFSGELKKVGGSFDDAAN